MSRDYGTVDCQAGEFGVISFGERNDEDEDEEIGEAPERQREGLYLSVSAIKQELLIVRAASVYQSAMTTSLKSSGSMDAICQSDANGAPRKALDEPPSPNIFDLPSRSRMAEYFRKQARVW